MTHPYTDTWHQDEAAAERAWLDQWARTAKALPQPDTASRPTHNPVMRQTVLTAAHRTAANP